MFRKRKEDGFNEFANNDTPTGAFNPSKTFGGERARMMFPLKSDIDDFSEQKKDVNYNQNQNFGKEDQFKKNVVNPQSFLPGL
jgi:hypothetical protein